MNDQTIPPQNPAQRPQRPPNPQQQQRPPQQMQNPMQPPPQQGDIPKTTAFRPTDSHEIEYIIHGNDMQFAEIILDPDETVVSEAGSMMYMEQGIRMETKMGDGSKKNSGVFGSMMGAAKRKLSGEQLFMTHFTNRGNGKSSVAFAAPYPGQIMPVDLGICSGGIYCHKGGFLCGAKGTALSVGFTKRIGAGMFGGEGYILQKLLGDGLVFVHSGGTIIEKTLAKGQTISIDTGSVVGFETSVDFDIKMVKGISNMMFGGEDLFLSTLTGPGRIWMQSMPFVRLTATIRHAMILLAQQNK